MGMYLPHILDENKFATTEFFVVSHHFLYKAEHHRERGSVSPWEQEMTFLALP